MAEEVGFFALDTDGKIDAPIVITEGGIAIGGTAVPGLIVEGSVRINPAPTDLSGHRTVTVQFFAEGGVVLNPSLHLVNEPDGSTRVHSRPPSNLTDEG
ncbi:hypothetical protein [Rhodococcoides fascians]|uniref:hypothetical protein n=1 Tax=Rhodococcoides fascians TaxID=1828 RepID=UPI000522FD87|nr:hypothetical protein [Rhodococcus fascians]